MKQSMVDTLLASDAKPVTERSGLVASLIEDCECKKCGCDGKYLGTLDGCAQFRCPKCKCTFTGNRVEEAEAEKDGKKDKDCEGKKCDSPEDKKAKFFASRFKKKGKVEEATLLNTSRWLVMSARDGSAEYPYLVKDKPSNTDYFVTSEGTVVDSDHNPIDSDEFFRANPELVDVVGQKVDVMSRAVDTKSTYADAKRRAYSNSATSFERAVRDKTTYRDAYDSVRDSIETGETIDDRLAALLDSDPDSVPKDEPTAPVAEDIKLNDTRVRATEVLAIAPGRKFKCLVRESDKRTVLRILREMGFKCESLDVLVEQSVVEKYAINVDELSK